MALITGASRGIGRATALAFATAGASVACMARSKEEIEDLSDEIRDTHNVEALAVAGDVLNPRTPSEVISHIEAALGPVDILATCAGIASFSPIAYEVDLEKWWHVLEVNVKGTVAFIRALVPSMLTRQTGTIIAVTSNGSVSNDPHISAYCSSKAAINGAIGVLNVELQPQGVISFAVHPGAVPDTGLRDRAINMDAYEKDEKFRNLMKSFPDFLVDDLTLTSKTFIALAADPRAKILSGRYVAAWQNLMNVIAEVERELREVRDDLIEPQK